ncbi:MAG: ATP-binding protein [Archangium sp.]|nr:ATP-binding protein [Archangium sp.]
MANPTDAAGITFERVGDYAFARPTQRREDCPECGGTGLVRTRTQQNGREYDLVAPCGHATLQRRATSFNAARLPAVQAQATLETYKPSNAEQHRALQVAKEFAFRWPQLRGFVLSGPVGTGKTHLLCATLKHLAIELGVKVSYVEISLLYSQIRRGFQDGKSGGEIIGPLSTVDVLAIDELGKGRGSQFELETLDELIARRYNAGKVTLFATNYSLKPPEERAQRGYFGTETALEAGKDSKLLCDRVGDRIYSRLCEMCDFVEFPGATPDMRRSPQLAGRKRG